MLLAGAATARADDDVVAPQLPRRFERSLGGPWKFVLDPGDVGLAQDWPAAIARSGDPPPSAGEVFSMLVPRAFEARQAAGAYDGVVWYWRTEVLPPSRGMRVVLSFERVNHACRVWVNGREVGEHVGGYDPFELDVSEALGGERRMDLVVRVVDPGATPVDGLTLSIVPHSKESWYENYGGILGPVSVSGHADVKGRIERLVPDPESGRVSVEVELRAPDDDRTRHVELELRARPLALRAALPADGDHRPPAVALARRRVTVRDGRAVVPMEIDVPAHETWSPEEPWRYLLGLQVHGDRRASGPDDERAFGFRTVALDPDGFRLNGRRLVLHGVLYQPHYIALGGLYPPAEELEEEVLQMLDVGFNLVRAHVRPAPPAFLDACDRHGLLVIEEPAIGWVDMSPRLQGWLEHEVEWMVRRDHHHPSIVVWGIFNELSGDAHRLDEPVTQHLLAFDRTRPVLVDSGGFFRSGYVPTGGDVALPMRDEHVYPPCPIPFEERVRMRTLDHADGPVLVSEFGYGTLLDTERHLAGFFERKVLGVERNTFAAMRERTRAALASGDTWDDDAWLDVAQQVHVGMTREMVELLRANPRLAGIVYTQWRAVSTESSAGLLDPWGEERPALRAMRDALAPLKLAVFPARPSVREGSTQAVDVAVINDTGAPVAGAVVLNAERGAVRDADGTVGRGFDRQVFPPGVTVLTEEAFRMTGPGEAAFRGYFVDEAGEVLVMSREVPQRVVPPPPARWTVPQMGDVPDAPVELVIPEGDDTRLHDFARREGFGVRDLVSDAASVPVILLDEPERLHESLDPAERLRLWRHVYQGGTAIVLLEDLPMNHIGRLAGSPRGIRMLPDLPVRVGIGLAVGNFIGRSHVMIEADEPRRPGDLPPLVFETLDAETAHEHVPADAHARLFESHEASVAPGAMLVGELPRRTRAAAITLNHYRQRTGTLVAAVPFGRGEFVFSGLPLLDPVLGEADPRRDRLLSNLVESVALGMRNKLPTPEDTAAPLPLTPEQVAAYGRGTTQLARFSAVLDRYSFVTSGRPAPPAYAVERLIRRDQGLAALFEGTDAAWEYLEEAFAGLWTEDVAAFVEREEDLLARTKRLILRGTPDARELGALVVQEWGFGVMTWVGGDREGAAARFDAADALLASDPGR